MRGEAVAGNVAAVPTGTLDESGLLHITYQPFEDATERRHEALVRVFRLPGDFRLLVGRDIEERQRLQEIVTRASLWGIMLMIVLGIGGGYYVSRRVLARIEEISETSRNIMAGDLASASSCPGAATSSTGCRKTSTPCWSASPAHAGAEAGLRQHRPRSQDAADAHAQPREAALAGEQALGPIARRWKRRSRSPTSSSAPSTRS
jgi:HAMP domain-containing protein